MTSKRFAAAPLLLLATTLVGIPSTQGASVGAFYRVSQTFHVGGEGGWDYLTVDPERKLLYVPRSTHTNYSIIHPGSLSRPAQSE